jgi:folylpolyglutamate synthase/dihydropteroate synthase
VAPDTLAKEAEAAGARSAQVVAGVSAAVDRAREIAGSNDLVLVTGSHYSVGEARTHLVGPGPAV